MKIDRIDDTIIFEVDKEIYKSMFKFIINW